ncbi:MAG: glycosyltransferase family 4 protein [Planctomycetes bacterium]|nr:glycosyltransferase family 4 protein [Planctomycetota bacterium]
MQVVISSPVHPPELGGPAVYGPSLARALAEHGHDVQLVSFVGDPVAARDRAVGYAFTPIPRAGTRLTRHRAYARILESVCRTADVLIGLDHLAGPAVRSARRCGIPLVLRVMVDPAWELASRFGWSSAGPDALRRGRRGLRVRVVQACQRRWWRAARWIICPSRYLQAVVADYGVPATRASVLHNPFHGELPLDLAPRNPATGRLVLVARLVAWKRIDEALNELRTLPESFTLDIVGDGPEKDRLIREAHVLGLGERVRFHGNLSHAETLERVRSGDAILSLSRYEGMSHTLVEAMAVGTPVVATAVGGNVELLGADERGLLLEPDGPWNLSSRLVPWLERPAEVARRNAFSWVREHFDRTRVFDQLERRLAEIVHG